MSIRVAAPVTLLLLFLTAAPVTTATAGVPADSPQEERSVSCRCCAECRAARKRSGTASEAGPKAASDGCGTCCDKCGIRREPSPAPPEKVEEKVRTKHSEK